MHTFKVFCEDLIIIHFCELLYIIIIFLKCKFLAFKNIGTNTSGFLFRKLCRIIKFTDFIEQI